MASAPWWNLLFEIVALPVMNTLLPFVLAGILAIVLLALGSILKRPQNRPRSPK
jgi:hypothetical protein